VNGFSGEQILEIDEQLLKIIGFPAKISDEAKKALRETAMLLMQAKAAKAKAEDTPDCYNVDSNFLYILAIVSMVNAMVLAGDVYCDHYKDVKIGNGPSTFSGDVPVPGCVDYDTLRERFLKLGLFAYADPTFGEDVSLCFDDWCRSAVAYPVTLTQEPGVKTAMMESLLVVRLGGWRCDVDGTGYYHSPTVFSMHSFGERLLKQKMQQYFPEPVSSDKLPEPPTESPTVEPPGDNTQVMDTGDDAGESENVRSRNEAACLAIIDELEEYKRKQDADRNFVDPLPTQKELAEKHGVKDQTVIFNPRSGGSNRKKAHDLWKKCRAERKKRLNRR
jgi:hypothetical protein